MNRTVSILMVGHSLEDADWVRGLLATDGLSAIVYSVTVIDCLPAVLQEREWDVLLADDRPDLRLKQVLAQLSVHAPDIPVIALVSHQDEQAAAHLMAAGARDFILKTSPARLVPTIRCCFQQTERLREYYAARLALERSDARFRAIASNLPGLVFQFVLESNGAAFFPYVSEGSKALLGLSPEKLQAQPEVFAKLILTDDVVDYEQSLRQSSCDFSVWNWEGRVRPQGDEDVKWVSLRATPRRTQRGAVLWDGIMLNITRNKQIEIEMARSRAQLAELASYSQKVKERERARIAREIHDDIGSTLTAIKCELVPCLDGSIRAPLFYRDKAATIETLIDMVIDSTRQIALDLRPGILDCGIVAAVQWQAREFQKRTGISCLVECGYKEISLDGDLAVAIFRIFQETLTNIAKHADASEVQVNLSVIAKCVCLVVSDNGRGITQPELEKEKSFGIRGMQERCQQLGGRFHVQGSAGSGTTVRIWIPVNYQESFSA